MGVDDALFHLDDYPLHWCFVVRTFCTENLQKNGMVVLGKINRYRKFRDIQQRHSRLKIIAKILWLPWFGTNVALFETEQIFVSSCLYDTICVLSFSNKGICHYHPANSNICLSRFPSYFPFLAIAAKLFCAFPEK